MTNDEAREILSAYRPGTEDDHDPTFAEVRQMLETDASLRSWFDRERGLDGAMRRHLADIPVPVELLPRLLAAPKLVPAPRSPSLLRWLPLAACLALLLGLVAFWPGGPEASKTRFQAYQTHLADWLAAFPPLEREAEKLADLKSWLRGQPGGLADFTLPAALERFPTIGCRRVQWRDRTATLVCFMVDGESVHVVMLPGPSLEGAPAFSTPEFERAGELNLASWSRDGTLYVVLTKAPDAVLRRSLAG